MKVIAKDNLKYDEYPYTNWLKDQEYDCHEDEDLLEIVDEQGVVFYFSGRAKDNLGQVFDFIQ